MKKRILPFLLLMLSSVVAFGQVIGSTTYDIKNNVQTYFDHAGGTDAGGTDANALTLASPSGTTPFATHSSHGMVFNVGNTISMNVTAYSTISFDICVYGNAGATWVFKDSENNIVGSFDADSDIADYPSDGATVNLVYNGTATTLTATLESGYAYLHKITINNSEMVAVNGNVTEATGIPSGYSLIFTNQNGDFWLTQPASAAYTIQLPVNNTFSLSLADADGFIISTPSSIEVTAATTQDITTTAVSIFTVSGSITGLTEEDLNNLSLTYTPAMASEFVPAININATEASYTIDLEPNNEYTISVEGINDYILTSSSTLTITGATTADITFEAKPTYEVTITTENSETSAALTVEQEAALLLTFTNDDDGYAYEYTLAETIALRNGTYTITYDGIDAYALEIASAQAITITDAVAAKTLTFDPVSSWIFSDKIISSATAYKGLIFTGSVDVRSSDLQLGSGSTIAIPVRPGQKVTLTDYYKSNYSVEGGATVANTSNDTSNSIETVYNYTGTANGTVNVAINGTTYFKSIVVDIATGNQSEENLSTVDVKAIDNAVLISNVSSAATVKIYSLNGILVNTVETANDTKIALENGIWIIQVATSTSQKVEKVSIY